MRRALYAAVAAAMVTVLAAGCAGVAGKDVDSLDQRVVNGLVQRPGGSGYYDDQWVSSKILDLVLSDVQQCLTDMGRDDVAPQAESYLQRFNAAHNTELPSPEWYRREGAVPKIYREGMSEEDSVRQQLAVDCFTQVTSPGGPGGEEASSIPSRARELQMAWVADLGEYFIQNPTEGEFDEFQDCLASETGYPPEKIEPGMLPNVYSFTDWWAAQHGGLDISQADNLEGGQIFADCLDIYTDARAEATDDMRSKFIDSHYQDLKEINDALVG